MDAREVEAKVRRYTDTYSHFPGLSIVSSATVSSATVSSAIVSRAMVSRAIVSRAIVPGSSYCTYRPRVP